MENQTIYTVIGNKSVKTEVKLSDKLRSVSKWLRSIKSISEKQGNLRLDLESAEKDGDKKKAQKIQKRLSILAYIMEKKIEIAKGHGNDKVLPKTFAQNITKEEFAANIRKENAEKERREAEEKDKAQKEADEAEKAINDPAKRAITENLQDPAELAQENTESQAETEKSNIKQNEGKGEIQYKLAKRAKETEAPETTVLPGIAPEEQEEIGNVVTPHVVTRPRPIRQEFTEEKESIEEARQSAEKRKEDRKKAADKKADERKKKANIAYDKAISDASQALSLELQDIDKELAAECKAADIEFEETMKEFNLADGVISKSSDKVEEGTTKAANVVTEQEAAHAKEIAEKTQKMEEQGIELEAAKEIQKIEAKYAKTVAECTEIIQDKANKTGKEIEDALTRMLDAADEREKRIAEVNAEKEKKLNASKEANKSENEKKAETKEKSSEPEKENESQEKEAPKQETQKTESNPDKVITAGVLVTPKTEEEAEIGGPQREGETGEEYMERMTREEDAKRRAEAAQKEQESVGKHFVSSEPTEIKEKAPKTLFEQVDTPEVVSEKVNTQKQEPSIEMTNEIKSSPEIMGKKLVIAGEERPTEVKPLIVPESIKKTKPAEDAQKEQEPVGKHFASSKPTEIKEEAPKTLFEQADTSEVVSEKVNTQKQEPSIEMTNEIKSSPEIMGKKLVIAGEERPIEVKPLIVPESTKEAKPSEDKTKEDYITSQVDRLEALTKDIKEAKEALNSNDKSIVALATADLDKIQNEINGVLHPKSLTENPAGLKSSAELATEKANKKFSEEILQGLKERNIDADLLDELSNDEAEVEKGRTK